MLKILARTLIVLCVCGLVAAAIYALVQSNPSIGLGREGSGGPPPFQNQSGAEGADQFPPGGRQRPDHDGEGSFDLARGLGGVVGNFILIAVVCLAVAAAQQLPARLFRPASRR